MVWNKGKKEELNNIELVGLNKWVINFSQKEYTPINSKDNTENKDDNNIQYLPIVINELPTLDILKQSLINLQNEYDVSVEVNSFSVNGNIDWMDKNTRNSLKETLNVVEKSGQNKYTFWVANEPIELPISFIRNFLDKLELYAIECYQVTNNHISEISKIDNLEQLFEYDISKGYPSKIELTL